MVKYNLKKLVKDRRLTVNERLSGRLGYMGTAFIIAKQWNLVAVNLNVIIGYIIYLITST